MVAEAEAAKKPLLAYIGALAEYRVYLTLQAMAAKQAVADLADAVSKGDADKARQAYLTAHQAYGHLKPMSGLFTDLDTKIDVRPEYLEKREADPAFSGFYQIGQGLYSQADLQTLTPAVTALAEQMDALTQRVRALDIPPAQLATASSHSMQRLSGQLADEAWPLPASVELDYARSMAEGGQTVIQRLSPMLTKADPDLLKRLEDDYSALLQGLENTDATEPDAAQRKALAALADTVATDVASINTALSLD